MPSDFNEQCLKYILEIHRVKNASYDFIQQLEQLLGIPYLGNPSQSDSLCYATSEHIREDYKIGFTTADLRAYLKNQKIHSNGNFDTFLKDIFPQSSQIFWTEIHCNNNLKNSDL